MSDSTEPTVAFPVVVKLGTPIDVTPKIGLGSTALEQIEVLDFGRVSYGGNVVGLDIGTDPEKWTGEFLTKALLG